MGFKMGQMFVTCDVLTSFSLSDILVDGCVFLPPVMDLTAPILYHILECGFESTNLERKANGLQHISDQLSIICQNGGNWGRREGEGPITLLIDAKRWRQAAHNKTV